MQLIRERGGLDDKKDEKKKKIYTHTHTVGSDF